MTVLDIISPENISLNRRYSCFKFSITLGIVIIFPLLYPKIYNPFILPRVKESTQRDHGSSFFLSFFASSLFLSTPCEHSANLRTPEMKVKKGSNWKVQSMKCIFSTSIHGYYRICESQDLAAGWGSLRSEYGCNSIAKGWREVPRA